MKKILLVIAAVAGALAIQKKFKDQQAEQDLWSEATDKVQVGSAQLNDRLGWLSTTGRPSGT